jgi:hypothetical protein
VYARDQPSEALMSLWAADARRGIDPFRELRPNVTPPRLPPTDVVEDEEPRPAKRPGRRLGIPLRSRP